MNIKIKKPAMRAYTLLYIIYREGNNLWYEVRGG